MKFLVQRKLPGVQGQNGCWSDLRTVDAETPEAACEQLVEEVAASYAGVIQTIRALALVGLGDWDEYHVYRQPHTTYTHSLEKALR